MGRALKTHGGRVAAHVAVHYKVGQPLISNGVNQIFDHTQDVKPVQAL